MSSNSNGTVIHVKNVQKLMIEFNKYLYGLSAPIMNKNCTKRVIKYNLQSCRVTPLRNPFTKKYGTDTEVIKLPNLNYATSVVWTFYHR